MPGAVAPLIKDVACRANMMWATRLDPAVSVAQFLDNLKQQQFSSGQGGIPGLAVLDHDDTGHRVIFIARTGRIQIRLDALTKHEERVDAAQHIYGIVQLAADQALSADSNDSQHGAD